MVENIHWICVNHWIPSTYIMFTLVWHCQACDLRHYSLFSLMSSKLTLFTLFSIFETLFIIFVKFRHYLYWLDIICLNWFKIGTKWVNCFKIGSNRSKMDQNGSNSLFCRESCYVAIMRFFGHYFLKIDIILPNIRHYLCNFGRHYLSNFQITGLNMFLKLVPYCWNLGKIWTL